LATQNPIEQEGTYPLPEAQVDRFMLKLKVNYPNKDEERLIVRQEAKTDSSQPLKPIITKKKIFAAQKTINDIYVDEKVEEYILNLVFATRNPEKYALDDLQNLIEYGASPRASINLVLASKARAFLEHRGYITPEDVRYIGADILRHRIILTYEAEAEEITSDDIVQRLFDTIEVP
jgi:MoxR-like ATPase